jgi:hypothetical protein
LGEGRLPYSQREQQRPRCREHAQISLHSLCLLFEDAGLGRPAAASMLARFIGLSCKSCSFRRLTHLYGANHDPKRWATGDGAIYLLSQTSSTRAPLEMLLTMIVRPFT